MGRHGDKYMSFRITLLINILMSALILVSFQNCGNFKSAGTGDSSHRVSLSLASNGNGEGYEGSLSGDYYRMVPNHQCESTDASYGTLKVDANGVPRLTINRKLNCAETSNVIDAANIYWSAYNPFVVGFQEGLYERSERTPLPSEHTIYSEAWCRNQQSSAEGFDVLIKYDSIQFLATAQIFIGEGYSKTGDLQSKSVDPFSVNRLITNNIASYQAPGFNLQVERGAFMPDNYGEFQGHLNTVINGTKYDLKMNCYLGGELDPLITTFAVGK